jgi:serine/threonine protein kinase
MQSFSLRLKDVVIDQKQLYLIFEHMDKDLRKEIENLGSKFLEPIKIKKYLYQMLAGIADCHLKRIIHRDLKPANILLDNNGTRNVIKIASKSQTLGSHAPSPSQSDPTQKKWSHYGTGLPRSYWDRWITAPRSMFGLLAASLLRW